MPGSLIQLPLLILVSSIRKLALRRKTPSKENRLPNWATWPQVIVRALHGHLTGIFWTYSISEAALRSKNLS
jgi:hypothetical protein